MAYVRETILDSWADKLAGVSTPDGYESDAGCNEVFRFVTLPDDDVILMHWNARTDSDEGMFYVLDPASEVANRQLSQSNQTHWTMDMEIACIARADSDTPSGSLNKMIGDVKKLVAANRKAAHTNVIDSKVTSVSLITDLTKPHSGAVVEVEIRFETTDSAP